MVMVGAPNDTDKTPSAQPATIHECRVSIVAAPPARPLSDMVVTTTGIERWAHRRPTGKYVVARRSLLPSPLPRRYRKCYDIGGSANRARNAAHGRHSASVDRSLVSQWQAGPSTQSHCGRN